MCSPRFLGVTASTLTLLAVQANQGTYAPEPVSASDVRGPVSKQKPSDFFFALWSRNTSRHASELPNYERKVQTETQRNGQVLGVVSMTAGFSGPLAALIDAFFSSNGCTAFGCLSHGSPFLCQILRAPP